jgi:hypothetical protein
MNVHGKRALLNPPGIESTAAIVAEVENTAKWRKGYDRDGDVIKSKWNIEPNCTVRISDCDRAVSLTIEFGTEDEREAALFKIDRMVETLMSFRIGLEIEQARYVERLSLVPKK